MTLRAAVLQGAAGDVDRATLSRVQHAARQYRRRLGLRDATEADGDTARLLAGAFPRSDRPGARRGGPVSPVGRRQRPAAGGG